MGDDHADRRANARRPVYLGVELVEPGGSVSSAITKNASDGGLLLLTRTPVHAGARIEFHVLRPDAEPGRIRATGRVVRVAELTEEESCVWASKVAVELDEPFGEFYRDIAELSTIQVKVYPMT